MTQPSSSSSDPAAVEATYLVPGFRFHPTDEELVSYYLKRKVLGRPLKFDAIAEVDLYKIEPWDLPACSRLRSRDSQWYFFSRLDRKHANRPRTNRATSAGHWKTTGKDREVRLGHRLIGMKKTLVFHAGRAPKGHRTNWVMHEYRLDGDDVPQDSFVVCRIFQKGGPGPQNGAQYGAPFVEEEWDDDNENVGLLPARGDAVAEREASGAMEKGNLQMSDLIQILPATVVVGEEEPPSLDPVSTPRDLPRDKEGEAANDERNGQQRRAAAIPRNKEGREPKKPNKNSNIDGAMERYMKMRTKQAEDEDAHLAKENEVVKNADFSIKRCVSVLNTMEVTKEEKAKAFVLFKNQDNREIFLSACNEDLESAMIWLMNEMA